MAGREIVKTLDDLCDLDDGLHWFCPRSSADESSCYYDEDCFGTLQSETNEQREVRKQHIQEAELRRDQALEGSKILAFDGSDAAPYQEKFRDGLTLQMQRCDICVREFHRARPLLKGRLEVDFDADDVQFFMQKFDNMNKQRISSGLNNATNKLSALPEDKRSIMKAGNEGMYAMFEALNCLPFLRDEEVLARDFDRPFKMVNTRKKIKLPCYAPGMTAFLYSHNADRSTWAFRNFNGIKRDVVAVEFEQSVRPFLQAGLARVSVTALEKDFLPVFWKATQLILSKLDKTLMANNLRAMDANLWQTGLEHFQVDDIHFQDLVASYQILLETAPGTFWDAMGAITPQNVLDTVFRSPVLERLFTIRNEHKPLELEEKLTWVKPFILSIKPATLVGPTRTILDVLLKRFQTQKYSQYAQTVCHEAGLEAIHTALRHMKANLPGGPTVTHMIALVAKDYIALIMSELDGIERKQPETQIDKSEQVCLDIIQEALSLDVQSLAYDRYLIERKTAREGDQELSMSGLNIWKMSMKHVVPGYPALPTAILAGVQGLLPLEKFAPRQTQVQDAEKTTKGWNAAFDRVLGHLKNDFLDRLEAFSPDQLVDLFQDQHAVNGLIALLSSGEQNVHQSVLGMLKTMSGEDSRRDSLMHVVKIWFNTTLSAFSLALKAIAKSGAFSPCPTMLKLCSDVFSCLCDSQDGVLRSKDDWVPEDAKALESFWQMTWSSLHTVFEQTESWSNMGYDKQLLQDFCRETMDFAENAFSQYQVFSNALREALPASQAKDTTKWLLECPSTVFSKQVKWLRLRDDYLISKAVTLTSKMLLRLKETDIQVPKEGRSYVEDVCVSKKVKTNLSMNQKAELQRALEKHLGEPLDDVSGLEPGAATKYKQSSLAGWTSSGRSTPAGGEIARPKKPGTIDVDAWSGAAKARKSANAALDEDDALLASMTKSSDEWRKRREMEKRLGVGKPAPLKQQKQVQNQQSFLEKRKREKEETERKRREAAAKNRGTALGAGTGVQGVGDVGKDHSRKGDNVMISSDEESDDGSDLDEDLFGTSKSKEKKERKFVLPNVDPNGAIGLKPEQKRGPTKIQRTQRNLKDLRARLAPDLQPLHKAILKWEFFHDGDYPPNSNEWEFKQVTNTFTDPTSYQQTFQPLLTLEAWQGMVKSREENTSKPYEVKVGNRSNVDSFIEVSSLLGHSEQRELQLSEGDIILLSKSKKPTDDVSAPHCLARIYKVKRQKAHLEMVYQVLPNSQLAPHLTMQNLVYGIKIQSVTPLEREYGALQALQYYDLCNQIVRARPSQRYNFSDKQIAAAQDIWNVNKAQGEAICAAMDNEGFSLIQGPPGSGKTKTIVAIVGGLLSNALNSSSSMTKIHVPQAANGARNVNGDSGAPRKLLVCAPSNAAVDELVMRLKNGVKTRNGRTHELNVVRIGRSDAINQQVMDVTMDALVAKKLGTDNNDQKQREKNAEVFKEHEKVSTLLRELYQQRDAGEVTGQALVELESNIMHARRRKNELGVKIDNVKDQERNAGREAELNRKRAQQAVLDDAHVICATLSGSGHDMFQSLNIEFETVIIDEAAQCVEMSSLIPLKYGCIKCIMVGDPKQLPPTVFSKEAARFQYEQSLFVRMQNNFAEEVYLLDTQYRMHPDISLFPSRTFYDGLLKDGPSMAALRKQPWHKCELLAPYRFFDVRGQHQAAPKGHSLINLAEVDIAMALFDRLTTDFKGYDFRGSIGIITPYKSQLRVLKDRFAAQYGSQITDVVEFNTTDAFQGRESEIIIFSCVRASPAGGIGFLQDIRRMNVGLTRAKSSLWVLGNSESLVRGQFWRKLVEDAKARDSYTTGNLKGMLAKPSSAFPAARSKDSSMADVDTHVPQMDGSREGRRASSTNGASKLTADRGSAAPTPLHDAPSSEMEGVRYRFEDRVKPKSKNVSGGSARPSPQPGPGNRSSHVPMEDVEMQDSEPAVTSSRAATPASNNGSSVDRSHKSRSGTPADVSASGVMNKSGTGRNRGTDAVDAQTKSVRQPHPTDTVQQQQQQPVPRKRTGGNPFMPAKKKPKPQN